MTLPLETREEIVLLRLSLMLSAREIADRIGCAPGTVWNVLDEQPERIRALLREQFQTHKRCPGCGPQPLKNFRTRRQGRCKKCLRLSSIERTYGIDRLEAQTRLFLQQDRCAICPRKLDLYDKATHIDHCHDTLKVRGILCMHCNLGLGHFEHNPERLIDAAEYLNRTRTA